MRSLTLAGLVTVAAALPQYSVPCQSGSVRVRQSSQPCKHSAHAHHHNGTASAADYTNHTTTVAPQLSVRMTTAAAADATPGILSLDGLGGPMERIGAAAGESSSDDAGSGSPSSVLPDGSTTITTVVYAYVTFPATTTVPSQVTTTASAEAKSSSSKHHHSASTTHHKTAQSASTHNVTSTHSKTRHSTSAAPSSASTHRTNATSTSTAAASTGIPGSKNSTDALRGVNIGNWLILEKYMDLDDTFAGAFASADDQYHFDGTPGAAVAIQHHWSTWFTKADVEQIVGYGFNALRIPIGYWAFDNVDTPYQTGSAFWLDQAIEWARMYGLKVLIDCHGSPGSQNGKEHSGEIGSVDWQSDDNMQKSTDILVTMAKKYGAANYSDVIWGIEMVNEPLAGLPNVFSKSVDWAETTYSKMLDVVENKDLRLVTHDSFMGASAFVAAAAAMGSKTFGVDLHNYQLYTDADDALTQDEHISKACGWAATLAAARVTGMPLVVGEWSVLTNICAKSDGSTVPQTTGCGSDQGCSCADTNPSKWTPNLIAAIRKYTEAQLQVFEQNSDGYFLWSWKGPGGWGVKGPADVGAFPSNVVTDRKYGDLCGLL